MPAHRPSGDDDPADGDHDTFFNLLPSNHPYYGFADQLAFQNLWDSFVQLRLAPHPMLALNLFVHQFRLNAAVRERACALGDAPRPGRERSRAPPRPRLRARPNRRRRPSCPSPDSGGSYRQYLEAPVVPGQTIFIERGGD